MQLIVPLQLGLEGIHRSPMERVRIGNAMMEEVARHGDEDAGEDEEEVGSGGGVGAAGDGG